ncbi:MAG TPA: DUF4199 domain-containing protein [Opitutus sp.]|nr:DUF4199 domain-containing protein [Opitutus sp.]
MKTYLTYGLGIAGAGFLLNLILFFTGHHTELEKVGSAQTIASVVGLLIAIAGLGLAIRARRSEVPVNEDFGYGRALGAGIMTSLVSAIAGAILTFVYMHFINPGFNDLLVQTEINKWESAGMSQAQIDAAEGIMRKMLHPVAQAAFTVIVGVIFGTIISLVLAAFIRRRASLPPPVVA